MMKGILNFIRDFHKNSGSWILASTIVNKFVLFLIKVFVLMFVEKEVFGQITYSLTLIAFFTPFIGLGSPAGLMRYGSITEKKDAKKNLTDYAFSTGIVGTFILMSLMTAGFYWFEKDSSVVLIFLIILVWRMLSLFLNNHQSVQMRIDGKNRLYGQYDITNSLVLLVLAVLLTFIFNATGYVISLVIAPIIVFLIFSFRYGFPNFNLKTPEDLDFKTFWSYSILSSFTSVITQMVFLLDVFLIEKFLTVNDVAEYGAATLIPLNVLILPLIFMRTDFKKIAENEFNSGFLRRYYKNYFLLFLLLCVAGMLISVFLGEWIFSFLGSDYSPYKLFLILMIGACSALLLRVPLTGILTALGLAKINTITGIITLIIALILNLTLIPTYGLEGAAWATTISLTVSGLMNLIYFEWYLRKIKKDS